MTDFERGEQVLVYGEIRSGQYNGDTRDVLIGHGHRIVMVKEDDIMTAKYHLCLREAVATYFQWIDSGGSPDDITALECLRAAHEDRKVDPEFRSTDYVPDET